jgi:hypothetical protein
MEASEKPQQELRLGDGAVRALDDRLVIEALTVTDRRAARVVRERAEAGQAPQRTVSDAIEIGARVLDREDVAAEVDYVRAEFERHSAELRERLTRALAEGDDRLAERIANSFDGAREGSVQQQVRDMLARALEHQRTALAQQFSAEDGSNPLADFKGHMLHALRQSDARQQRDGEANRKRIEELTRELVELKERAEADRRVADAEEVGTRKGRTFEERAFAAIETIAAGRDDVAHHVGDEEAVGGGKRGDVVVELDAATGSAAGRLVFEIKDERLSKRDAWAVLNEALDQREADFALLLVAGEGKVPAGYRQLHQYEGNKMVIAVDREDPDGVELEAAYGVARALVRAGRERSLSVNASGVLDAVEAIAGELRRKQAMKRALTGITKNAETVDSGLDEMDAAVRGQLERIESLVASADAPE